MQHVKFLVPIMAALLIGIVVPLAVPKGHADDAFGSPTLIVSGYLGRGSTDSYLGGPPVDTVQAGNTLTFNVVFTANSYVYQRNLTMGVKFDWMTNYQNMTGSYIAVYAGQTVTLTLAYTIPVLTGQYANLNQATHMWTLQIWDMPVGASWHGYCYDNNYNPYFGAVGPMCNSFNTQDYGRWNPVAVYSGAQVSCYNNRLQANAILTSLDSAFRTTFTPAPGTSAALASYSQAKTQMALADNAYSIGDFNTAQTDYQNSLNYANAAQSSLGTIGGGTDTATFTSIWLESVAVLLGGIGAILVGFAGFKYLRGKTRSLPSYSPAASPKA